MSWIAPSGPTRKGLAALVLFVLLVHGALLLGVHAPLTVQLGAPPLTKVQIRMVPAPSPSPVPPAVRAPVRKVPSARPLMPAQAPAPNPPADPGPEPEAVGTLGPVSQASAADIASSVPTPEMAQVETPAQPQETLAQPQAPAGSAAWPLVPLGALPPSQLLHYQLSGMDKGLSYHASGELRWQHNGSDYELTLAVRAFLIGRRQWRSVGRIEATGLAPVRFSDSWRNERAAHFDRTQQRIVFSSNSTPAALEAGAQDQISLYVQLAAAMAGEAERFAPGTRLQVQTATVRDALPWSLVLEGGESIALEGRTLQALKWTCQPRNRFEARVEFWVAAEQAWLPLRIRITQTSGSYIDLAFRSAEPLPPLPGQGDAKSSGTAS